MVLATKELLGSSSRIRVHASPYTYVRTIVMESTLFSIHDYEKMLKMSLAEIIQFLEESAYKKEIDELAIRESGVQLVEHSVQRNFRRALEKLRRISDRELRLLIDTYVWRNDVQNIKTLLRAKRSGEPVERIERVFIPGVISKPQLLELYKLPSVEDILTHIYIPFMRSPLQVYKQNGLSGFESELTKAYYETTLNVAARVSGEGSALREFMMLDVTTTNILTVLKLKHEGADPERIQQYIIQTVDPSGGVVVRDAQQRLVSRLVQAKDIDEVFAILAKTKFGDALEGAMKAYHDKRSLLEAERGLRQYVLRRATLLTHQHPLSVDVVLGYLFAKTNEIRNIFVLIKGKQLGMPESMLEEEIVAR